MKLRSDGLGKTVLSAEVTRVKKVDDLIVFFAKTTAPVKWQTRMGFQEKDLRALMLGLLRPSNLYFVFKAFASALCRKCFPSKGECPETARKKEAT